MSVPLAFWRDQYIPLSEVKLAINDAGFVLGATVTDLCRTFRHQLFRLDYHLLRFRQSCQLAHIPQPRNDNELAAIAQELVRHNAPLLDADHDLALCMFATPGELGYYLGLPGGAGDAPPTFVMYTYPLPFWRYAHLIHEGARLVIPKTPQLPSSCISPTIKHRSRLHWWLAEHEAQQTGRSHPPEGGPLVATGLHPASALLLDARGRLTETAAANLLLVQRGRVLSPRYQDRDRILVGISLMVVEELCAKLNVPFEQADLVEEDCHRAEEAMLTSTPYGIAPVSSINGKALPWPGPVFHKLVSAWNREVGLDIWGQILRRS